MPRREKRSRIKNGDEEGEPSADVSHAHIIKDDKDSTEDKKEDDNKESDRVIQDESQDASYIA